MARRRFFNPSRRQPAPTPEEVYEASVMAEPTRPRLVTDPEVEGWLNAADERELNVWKEIDELMDALEPRHPARTAMVRKSVHWLRSQATANGMKWGV